MWEEKQDEKKRKRNWEQTTIETTHRNLAICFHCFTSASCFLEGRLLRWGVRRSNDEASFVKPFRVIFVLHASTLAVTLTYSSPLSFCTGPGAQGQGTGCKRPLDRKARKHHSNSGIDHVAARTSSLPPPQDQLQPKLGWHHHYYNGPGPR